MSGPVIVLGWDALDSELMEAFGVTDQFGAHCDTIETHVNQQIDEPHTRELWPSMLTGLHPDEHGITAVDDDAGVEWDDWKLNTLSDIANGLVPQPVLDFAGRRLRERGAALKQQRSTYYPENDIETVLDGADTRGISIPNYLTPYDERHGLDPMRDDLWASLLVDRDGAHGFDPAIDPPAIYDILGSELGRRVGHTVQALQNGHRIVWTWFGLLDTVGHIAPCVEAPLQHDWYHAAGRATQLLTTLAPPGATVISVSDHGLQSGSHTHYATIAADARAPVSEIDSIFDLAPWVGANASAPASDHTTHVSDGATEDVTANLEKLGYI